jgi:hypothetical protein
MRAASQKRDRGSVGGSAREDRDKRLRLLLGGRRAPMSSSSSSAAVLPRPSGAGAGPSPSTSTSTSSSQPLVVKALVYRILQAGAAAEAGSPEPEASVAALVADIRGSGLVLSLSSLAPGVAVRVRAALAALGVAVAAPGTALEEDSAAAAAAEFHSGPLVDFAHRERVVDGALRRGGEGEAAAAPPAALGAPQPSVDDSSDLLLSFLLDKAVANDDDRSVPDPATEALGKGRRGGGTTTAAGDAMRVVARRRADRASRAEHLLRIAQGLEPDPKEDCAADTLPVLSAAPAVVAPPAAPAPPSPVPGPVTHPRRRESGNGGGGGGGGGGGAYSAVPPPVGLYSSSGGQRY